MNLISRMLIWTWDQPPAILRSLIQRSSNRIFSISVAKPEFNAWNWLYILQYVYLVYWTIRFVISGVIVTNGGAKDYVSFDYLVTVFMKHEVFNTLFCWSMVLIPVSFIINDYIVHFKCFNYIWHLPALVQQDFDCFFKLNPRFWPEIKWTCPLKSIKNIQEVVGAFWNPPGKVKFSNSKWNYYPNLPDVLRVRVVFVHLIVSGFTLVASVLFGLLMLLFDGLVVYFNCTLDYEPLPVRIGIMVEMFLVSCCLMQLVRNLLFFHLAFAVLIFLMLHYAKHLNRALDQSIEHRIRNRTPAGEAQLRSLAAHYQHTFGSALLDASVADEQLISSIVTNNAVSNIPLNIYMIVYHIWFRVSHFAGDHASGWSMLVLQYLFSCAALVPMIRVSNYFGSSFKRLFAAQQYLNSLQTTRTKLQVLRFLEIYYCSDKRFSFSMGPIGSITSKSFFEGAMCYSGYVLFMFGIFQKEVLHTKDSYLPD